MTNPSKIFLIAFVCASFFPGCMSGNIEKGDICLRLGDYPGAMVFFSQELRHRTDNYGARLGLGKALLQKACDGDSAAWKDAIIQLEAARALSPESDIKGLLSEAYLERAHLWLSAGDSVAALDALARSIEYDNRAIEPLNLAGIVYFRMGEADKAQALFARAVGLDSTSAAARFNLGMVYWQLGRFSEAHGQWFAALAASPGDKDMVYWFALAEKKLREAKP